MKSKSLFAHLQVLVLLQCACVDLATSNIESAGFFFNDPDITQNWAFEMINIFPVWEKGIFGNGIRIRVNDEGVDASHDEFQGRFDEAASCKVFDTYFNQTSGTYTQHGTTVASIIGASGNNSQCAVGIAPQVTLSSCRMISLPRELLDDGVWDGSFLVHELDQFDISQNSFASVACDPQLDSTLSGTFANTTQCPFNHQEDTEIYSGGEALARLNPCEECSFPSEEPTEDCLIAVEDHCRFFFELDQEICTSLLDDFRVSGECSFVRSSSDFLTKGAMEGRNGKGIIYVFSSGNSFAFAGNSNFELQGRYIIFSGAVGRDGQSTSYSSPGASLLITAPAGDSNDRTTQSVATAGGGCQDAGPGTSFSSPIVSGVIALMLEVNPDLTWRDVQGVLATTSRPVTHTVFDDTTQVTNGAGLVHSNLYGFGIVDASAAVTAAESWELYGMEELLVSKDLAVNLTIGDDPNKGVSSQLNIGSEGSILLVENVEVDIYLRHLSRGHLQITLTSPDGTVSELTPGSIPENGQDNAPWTMRTVKNWGEVPVGSWTLTIVDEVEGDVNTECVDLPNFKGTYKGDPVGCDLLEAAPVYQDEEFLSAVKSLVELEVDKQCCICGGGTKNGDSCDNIPYPAAFGDICAGMGPICPTGELLPEVALLGVAESEEDGGRSIQETCCVTGGGRATPNPATFKDQLLGWELRVYAHEDPTKTRSPTTAPSGIPSTMPTTEPPKGSSGSPVDAPPTVEPTSAGVGAFKLLSWFAGMTIMGALIVL